MTTELEGAIDINDDDKTRGDDNEQNQLSEAKKTFFIVEEDQTWEV